jgi:hypothetical protein
MTKSQISFHGLSRILDGNARVMCGPLNRRQTTQTHRFESSLYLDLSGALDSAVAMAARRHAAQSWRYVVLANGKRSEFGSGLKVRRLHNSSQVDRPN